MLYSNTAPATATVVIKPAFFSKINWTQVGGAVLTLITAFVSGLPAEQAVVLLPIINLVQGAVTIVFKTWFTPSVTPESIKAFTE